MKGFVKKQRIPLKKKLSGVTENRGKVRIVVQGRKSKKDKTEVLETKEYGVSPFNTNSKEHPIFIEAGTGVTHSVNYQSINIFAGVTIPTNAKSISETYEKAWRIVETEIAERMTSDNMTEVLELLNSM